MRKLSLIFALMAGMMLPLTAVAQNSQSKSSSSKKKSKKSSKKQQVVEDIAPVVNGAPAAEELTFSDEQAMLNNQAVEAMEAKNYAKAEQLFGAMLQLGEFNITWMNLGKTYANEGKCLEAEDAYARVSEARKISDYPPEEINMYTEGFIRELREKCSAKIVMNCTPSDMMVSFDGGKRISCSNAQIAVTPGRHSIYGETSFGFNTVVTNVKANETTTVDLEVVDPEKVLAEAGITLDALNSKSKLFKSLGYSFLGVGAATLGAGLGLWLYTWFDFQDKHKAADASSSPDRLSKFDKMQAEHYRNLKIGYALTVVGGVVLVTGITLVIVDAVRYQPQIKLLEASSKSAFNLDLAPIISPEFSGFSLSGTF